MAMSKLCALFAILSVPAAAEPLPVIKVEGQSLAANARRAFDEAFASYRFIAAEALEER
jgi:hypothetical protein